MLNHFFGLCEISENALNYDRLETSLIEGATALGPTFRTVNHPTKRIIVATNNGLPSDPQQKITAALCGDLVSAASEVSLRRILAKECANESGELEFLLQSANGTFALAVIADDLWIATDYLGARPVYYSLYDGILAFGTSFSMVRRLTPADCHLDFQAASEEFAFGCPLGDRTLAREIKVLRGSHYIQCRANSFKIEQYDSFAEGLLQFDSLELSLETSARVLKLAIYERIQQGQIQAALLSGGLDSRVIVSELLEAGQKILAANLSASNTLDRVYAETFATAIGIPLLINNYDGQYDCITMGDITRSALSAAQAGLPAVKVFSGDGGGEIFGLTDVNSRLLKAIEKSGLAGAIDCMMQNKVSQLIAGSIFQKTMTENCSKGLSDEIQKIPFAGLPQKIFIVYLISDLRRHLHEYFASLNPEARELLLPFYDRRVLNAAIQNHQSNSERVGHRYYYQLLEYLSPLVSITPWQAYPTSLPCPVVGQAIKATSQWQLSKDLDKKNAKRLAFKILYLLPMKKWPVKTNEFILMVVCVLTILGYRNQTYIFRQLLQLNQYFQTHYTDSETLRSLD